MCNMDCICCWLQDTRELLHKALNAHPVSISTLEHAIQAGRNCRLLNKDLVKGADTKLRELKKGQQAQPRQQYAPPLMPPHTRPAYTPHRQTPTLQSAAPQPPKHIPVPQYVPQPAPKPQFVPRPYTPQDPPAASRYMPTPAPQQKPPKQEYMPAPAVPQQKAAPHYQPQQSATPQYQPAGPQQRATPQYQPQPLGPQQNPAQQNVPQQRPMPQYKPQQAPARQAPAPYMPQQASAQQSIPPQHVLLQPVPAPRVPPQPTAQLPVADAAQTRRQPAQEGHAASSTAAASTAAATAGHSKQPVQPAKGPPPGMPVRKGPQMAPSSDARAAAAAALSNLEPVLARAATPANNSAKPQPTQSAAASKSGGPEGRQDECVVCWAHEKDVVCIPCGHVAMCKGCSQAVLKKDGLCPVCRTQIREVFQLYRT